MVGIRKRLPTRAGQRGCVVGVEAAFAGVILAVCVGLIGTVEGVGGDDGPPYQDGLNTFEVTVQEASKVIGAQAGEVIRRWHLKDGAAWDKTEGYNSKACLVLPAGGSANFSPTGPGSEDSFLRTDYEVSFRAKRSGNVRLVMAVDIDAPKALRCKWQLAEDATKDWALFQYRTCIFAGLGRGQVRLSAEGEGTVWIDDFQIAGRLESDPPYRLEQIARLAGKWKFTTDPERKGLAARYYAPDFDDSKWGELAVDTWWETLGFKGYDGLGWYRTSFTVPASAGGQPVYLRFDGVDEMCGIWVDGRFVIAHWGWDHPFLARIDPFVERGRSGKLTVLVEDNAGGGGIYKVPALLAGVKAMPRLEAE